MNTYAYSVYKFYCLQFCTQDEAEIYKQPNVFALRGENKTQDYKKRTWKIYRFFFLPNSLYMSVHKVLILSYFSFYFGNKALIQLCSLWTI